MRSAVIADAGPLIALAKVKRLGLLKRLFGQVSVTAAVADELRLGSAAPGAAALDAALAAGWLVRLPHTGVTLAAHQTLDAGEASCLAAAAATPGTLFLIDERLGRREAQRLNIPHTGTAGILCAAKELGYLDAVLPVLGALTAAGYFLSDAVIGDARQRAGE